MAGNLTYQHKFVEGTEKTTLLLLHGTGGDGDSMLSLGHIVSRGSSLLSPRGKIIENGMPRFFRRYWWNHSVGEHAHLDWSRILAYNHVYVLGLTDCVRDRSDVWYFRNLNNTILRCPSAKVARWNRHKRGLQRDSN